MQSNIDMKYYLLLILVVFIYSSNSSAQYGSTSPLLQDQYGKKYGNLRLSATRFELGVVMNNEVRMDTIWLLNTGIVAMNVASGIKNSPFLKIAVIGSPLSSGGKGIITLTYDATNVNDYGYRLDRIPFNTDDVLQPQKFLMVAAEIHEYFPPASIDAKLPHLKIAESVYSFGKIKQEEKATHDYKIYNDGTAVLLFRKVKSNCTCIKATMLKKEIMPGDSTLVHVEYDSTVKTGSDSRTISLFTNDPSSPEVRFEFFGEIIK